MNYTQMNTTTLWFTISVIKATTNSHNRTRDMCTYRHSPPRTTELHRGTSQLELTVLIVTFATKCSFLLPEILKVSQH